HYSTLLANLVWLFVSSLIPLSTEYVSAKHFSGFAVAQYAVMMLLAGASFGLLRLTLLSVQRQDGSLQDRDKAEMAKNMGSLALYLLAVTTAYWRPLLSLGITASVTLIWIAPWLGTQRMAHMHAAHHPFPNNESR
ncbi:MAG: DUF1211 domain-containing protein, partial [Terriglobus roseus]|nr:DUF1211 domain-containing protein [Terriglobus roseus]